MDAAAVAPLGMTVDRRQPEQKLHAAVLATNEDWRGYGSNFFGHAGKGKRHLGARRALQPFCTLLTIGKAKSREPAEGNEP
ncbi:hypothetical protein DPM33_19575 [Mesorhizobium hawassense]|uniref:Uncharacterized protein n=1 Tax=Mesorhizobium hawassense TaxID=1209954 RepID=A0A330HMG4_9HYPH|nr:hypothetical protein DPM33_19575 [Mesorhizobium hawassense]